MCYTMTSEQITQLGTIKELTNNLVDFNPQWKFLCGDGTKVHSKIWCGGGDTSRRQGSRAGFAYAKWSLGKTEASIYYFTNE